MCFSHLGVFLISVKPLTTENTEIKTTPKFCKITVTAVHYLTCIKSMCMNFPKVANSFGFNMLAFSTSFNFLKTVSLDDIFSILFFSL